MPKLDIKVRSGQGQSILKALNNIIDRNYDDTAEQLFVAELLRKVAKNFWETSLNRLITPEIKVKTAKSSDRVAVQGIAERLLVLETNRFVVECHIKKPSFRLDRELVRTNLIAHYDFDEREVDEFLLMSSSWTNPPKEFHVTER
jgi:hypothetical protein